MSKGTLIVIEGLDGSGKATQAKLLFESLCQQGKDVRQVSFPDYDSDSSALVKMYLAGDFGSDPGDVNAYAASTFFAVDRYASFKKNWRAFYEAGGIVIADRYTTSNAVHQCSKLPEEEWDGFLRWLFTFEYELLGIPAPDAVDPAAAEKARKAAEKAAADLAKAEEKARMAAAGEEEAQRSRASVEYQIIERRMPAASSRRARSRQ